VRSLDVSLPRNMERSHAVTDVSLDLRQGEILCIVGESGSGKSVTACTIMGLLPPAMTVAGGEILYKGRDLLTLPERERWQMRGKAISMFFQDPLSALNPLMSIE